MGRLRASLHTRVLSTCDPNGSKWRLGVHTASATVLSIYVKDPHMSHSGTVTLCRFAGSRTWHILVRAGVSRESAGGSHSAGAGLAGEADR